MGCQIMLSGISTRTRNREIWGIDQHIENCNTRRLFLWISLPPLPARRLSCVARDQPLPRTDAMQRYTIDGRDGPVCSKLLVGLVVIVVVVIVVVIIVVNFCSLERGRRKRPRFETAVASD